MNISVHVRDRRKHPFALGMVRIWSPMAEYSTPDDVMIYVFISMFLDMLKHARGELEPAPVKVEFPNIGGHFHMHFIRRDTCLHDLEIVINDNDLLHHSLSEFIDTVSETIHGCVADLRAENYHDHAVVQDLVDSVYA